MPLRPEQISRHSTYWLDGGDFYLLVDNIAFRVHRYFFERESAYFRNQFEEARGSLTYPDGSSFERAYIIDDATPNDLANFLWVFYNPSYSIYTASREQWLSIFKCAELWIFPQVRALCLREISTLDDAMSDTTTEPDSVSITDPPLDPIPYSIPPAYYPSDWTEEQKQYDRAYREDIRNNPFFPSQRDDPRIVYSGFSNLKTTPFYIAK
jgi:hypothetical protein